MGTALALASAVCYGIADVAGGLLSRRVNFAVVALVGQAAAFLMVLVAASLVPGRVELVDLGWGALSGVGTGVGMAFLYRGLGRGAMSVVVPVSAVGGLAIPVVAGVALFGDRPTSLAAVGMTVAAPALWLVSRGRASTGPVAAAAVDGMIASLGIALQYLALAAAGPEAGIWPVAAGRLTAMLAIAPLLFRSPPGRWPLARYLLGAAFAGCCAALALVTYLLATRQQLVSIAVVLSSLYPVIPVLLGLTVLRERLGLGQTMGLVGAGVAVGLLSVG
jgi:drug/metabolite transporter (DMT)-like permease